jgi:hypothetical protein
VIFAWRSFEQCEALGLGAIVLFVVLITFRRKAKHNVESRRRFADA